MSYNIIAVIKDLATGKLKFASSSLSKHRQSICNECEVRNTTLNTCTACGCWLPAKTRLENSSCPMELW